MERITEKNKPEITTKERFAAMKIKLTQCDNCLGCNRLEDTEFPRDKEYQNYREGMTRWDKHIQGSK